MTCHALNTDIVVLSPSVHSFIIVLNELFRLMATPRVLKSLSNTHSQWQEQKFRQICPQCRCFFIKTTIFVNHTEAWPFQSGLQMCKSSHVHSLKGFFLVRRDFSYDEQPTFSERLPISLWIWLCASRVENLKTEKVPKYHSKSVRLPWAKVFTANYFLLKLLKDQSELALCDAGWIAE